ncbi:MAG: hypothetical protein NC320_13065 [Clostridium sp.]|nr:hypothetical protein [Clostridium sp.]
MVFAPYFGFRKNFFAKIMNLKNMVIVEDLIDVGLLYENYRGRINIHSVVSELVRSEFETNNDTCSDFIEIVRVLCLNDSSAGKELCDAFHIFIKLYGNQSDFVHTRTAELQSYIEMTNTNFTEYEPLKQLLGE